MKASELITELSKIIENQGDLDIKIICEGTSHELTQERISNDQVFIIFDADKDLW